jgi:hypothetical protein
MPNPLGDLEPLLAELDCAPWIAIAVQNTEIGARATDGLIEPVHRRHLQASFDVGDRVVDLPNARVGNA